MHMVLNVFGSPLAVSSIRICFVTLLELTLDTGSVYAGKQPGRRSAAVPASKTLQCMASVPHLQ
jgi:hypothetical protein